ncbi:hypothetical protein OsJ_11714 [Oryza sativa Japonica Group]|uniref:Uncharacterized protein n=1 Tax=Oryza sativa subsp. japonica TaxID=39947 RepID=A3AKC7_ORYSJ|nr:hypothetical protein OsJ_11714 [Oryza sativa Japonica Group]
MAVPRRDLAAVAAGVAVAAAGGLDGDDSGGLGGGRNIDWGLDRGQEGEPMAIEMGLTLSKTRKDDQTGE